MDSKGKAAGKGLLIQDNMASTLAVSQDQYVFAEESYGVPLNFRPENTRVYEETATTICNGTNPGHHQGVITYGIGNGQTGQMTADKEVSRTLDCMHDQKAIMTTSVDCRNATEDHVNGSLQYDSYKSLNSNNVCRQGYIVRRLTPLECCRLQGFPDGWAELKPYSDDDYEFWNSIHPGTPAQVQRWYDKLHTDSSEYKMWGNGIALPCALYVFEGIEEEIRLAHESPDVAND